MLLLKTGHLITARVLFTVDLSLPSSFFVHPSVNFHSSHFNPPQLGCGVMRGSGKKNRVCREKNMSKLK